MSQGARGGLVRTVFAGVGAVLCAGVVGCTGFDRPFDKSKDKTNIKQPGPGLPGTPTLPGGTGSAVPKTSAGATATPGAGRTPTGSGVSTTGGIGTPAVSGVVYPPASRSQLAPSVAPVGSGPAGSAFGSGGMPEPNFAQPAAPTYPGQGGTYPPAPGLTEINPIPPSAPGSTGVPVAPGNYGGM